jgi:hypothetical protein
MARITLISRDLTATDGAPVFEAINLGMCSLAVATFAVTTSGTPTTFAMRAAIEGSVDGGTTWHQLLRFGDITNAAASSRYARFPGVVTAAEAAVAASALTGASASGVIGADCPWPALIRGGSMLATLTGGSSPHILPVVTLDFR